MTTDFAYLNAIGTAVPPHDVHDAFITWANRRVEERARPLFARMAARAGIAHRWSVLPGVDGASAVDPGGFYAAAMPGTAARMAVYAREAPELALAAVAALQERVGLDGITHLVVASCTGFVAPGIDQIVAARLGLPADVERLLVGFMGCYAAIVALRSARHIVRSDPAARVLVVTVELSSLHLQDDTAVEPLLAMLQFGDGAAAALVTADARGMALGQPFAANLPDSADLIRWAITDTGFAMHLDGAVPGRIGTALGEPAFVATITGGTTPADLFWAVHAGGRSILDAVQSALSLPADALAASRAVLADNGNMSSATLMFVLARLLADPPQARAGVALAFGPGLAAEGLALRFAT
ncbi:putative naringenin-chalcone synthase [Sphingomonas insulae]|uniref:Type III polyketide synthase n=1 Tax=Sphingomonas insulae TaxID=424800 RepID=A0ABN1HM91_9SPHN|nr:type III polyketide synthase [Sphingomonas insulae]NIJ30139.1 putative naringenin-chalcone synthase [Sphingomonas insulae]